MKYMISDNLKQFKEINNFTLRKSAILLNINHSLLLRLINKKRTTASLDVICRIAEGLGVELDDLLFTNIYSN